MCQEFSAKNLFRTIFLRSYTCKVSADVFPPSIPYPVEKFRRMENKSDAMEIQFGLPPINDSEIMEEISINRSMNGMPFATDHVFSAI